MSGVRKESDGAATRRGFLRNALLPSLSWNSFSLLAGGHRVCTALHSNTRPFRDNLSHPARKKFGEGEKQPGTTLLKLDKGETEGVRRGNPSDSRLAVRPKWGEKTPIFPMPAPTLRRSRPMAFPMAIQTGGALARSSRRKSLLFVVLQCDGGDRPFLYPCKYDGTFRCMYIAIVPKRNSPPAVLLHESVREGGKIVKKTLANLSGLPPDRIAAVRRARPRRPRGGLGKRTPQESPRHGRRRHRAGSVDDPPFAAGNAGPQRMRPRPRRAHAHGHPPRNDPDPLAAPGLPVACRLSLAPRCPYPVGGISKPHLYATQLIYSQPEPTQDFRKTRWNFGLKSPKSRQFPDSVFGGDGTGGEGARFQISWRHLSNCVV